jgi:hypothetical protein
VDQLTQEGLAELGHDAANLGMVGEGLDVLRISKRSRSPTSGIPCSSYHS